MATLTISDFQRRVLTIPLEFSLFLGGGKGGSKSYTLCLLTQQHCETFRADARAVLLRRTYGELEMLVSHFLEIFATIYGAAVAKRMFNKSEMTFHHPHGGKIELGYLDSETDFLRYWGRSVTLLGVDEVGAMMTLRHIDLIRSNMRPPKHVITRIVFTANPGMALHSILENRYVRPAWIPFIEDDSDREWIYCPSTALDNPFVDVDVQMKEIEGIAKFDPDWARCLITGDWSGMRAGAFFGTAWKPEYSILRAMPPRAQLPRNWDAFISLDQGGGQAPTVGLFIARAKEGAWWIDDTFFPKDSVIIFAEEHDATDDFSGTLSYPITKMAEVLTATANDYNMRPDGYADPQVTQEHNAPSKLIDVYRNYGIGFQPWKRHLRVERWAFMRDYMDGAGPAGNRERPGLYVHANVAGWLQTVPYLPTDARKRDDLDTKANDHWADASAGAWYGRRQTFRVTPFHV